MSSPRQVGASLKQVARALEKVPDIATRDAAENVVDEAKRLGGTFMNRRYKLGATIKADKGSAVIRGKSAGFWAIKSYGRRESVARGRALGTAGGSFHAKRSKAARGDKRWDKVREFAEDESPRVYVDAVRKALR